MQSHLFPPRTRCNFCPALATTCKKRGGWAGADTAKQRSSCLGIDNEVDATTKNPPPPSPGDTINTAHVASSPLRLPPLFLISIVWDSQHTETPARGRGSDSSPRTRGQRHQSAEAAARSHPSHLHPPPPPPLRLSPVKFAQPEPSFLSGSHDSEQCARTSRPTTHTRRGREGGPHRGLSPPTPQSPAAGVRPTPLFAPPGPGTTPPQPAPHGPGRTCSSKQNQRPGQHGG